MRVVYCGSGWLGVVGVIQRKLPAGATIEIADRSRPLPEQLAGAQVVLPSNAPIGEAELEAAKDLLLIQQPAVGVDGIDLPLARSRGIPVCNAPGTNGDSVAQAALLLMLSLARRTKVAQAEFERARIGTPVGIELTGKTLGLIGCGRSGSRLKAAAEALGMHVIVVRSTSSTADLFHMLSRADVVSVHCPLDDRTRGLVGREAIAHMKPGALLINCARGPILEREAVEAALETGHLGGLGLDTFWQEPWDPEDPLYRRADVVTLPHVAGSTQESYERIAEIAAGNIARVMRGEEPLHRIA